MAVLILHAPLVCSTNIFHLCKLRADCLAVADDTDHLRAVRGAQCRAGHTVDKYIGAQRVRQHYLLVNPHGPDGSGA